VKTLMVTAETITDEQIRELRLETDLMKLALNTTGRNHSYAVQAARRVCAKFWNACHGGNV